MRLMIRIARFHIVGFGLDSRISPDANGGRCSYEQRCVVCCIALLASSHVACEVPAGRLS